MKTIACYIRVSTVGQDQAGQRREINRWLKGNGIDPSTVRWYIDKSTGDNLDRPDFERLQNDIFMGDIGTVVIWRLDRLSRTIRNGLTVLCDWCDKSLRVVSVSQQIDFNGTVGKIIASVLFGVAEMEQQTRRERQAAGIAAAKEAGVYIGRKPGTTKAKPARAKRLADKGLTHGEIATALGVSRRTVIRYLQS
ncbi:MAG: recombinase family protein [Planctomycetes bacterium]|nr:recombinase family protein [Planctomycetota bacterium]